MHAPSVTDITQYIERIVLDEFFFLNILFDIYDENERYLQNLVIPLSRAIKALKAKQFTTPSDLI